MFIIRIFVRQTFLLFLAVIETSFCFATAVPKKIHR